MELMIALFLFALLLMSVLAVVAVLFIFWIRDIIEFVGIPEKKFAAAGVDRTTAMLVLVILGLLGMLIWRLTGWRAKVLAS